MRHGRVTATVLLAITLVTPVLGGCRAVDAAAPAGSTTAVDDPLADIEATLQAVERELDADS